MKLIADLILEVAIKAILLTITAHKLNEAVQSDLLFVIYTVLSAVVVLYVYDGIAYIYELFEVIKKKRVYLKTFFLLLKKEPLWYVLQGLIITGINFCIVRVLPTILAPTEIHVLAWHATAVVVFIVFKKHLIPPDND
ncbi:MAG: hypothetical protein ACPGO5_03680 [Patescibacteria group bacterium]